ncbi:hypothetical protein [Lacicoccus alkaliphilus]|nr:hypothetical protein [Salinicoccus alkaliphilus]
MGGMAAISKNHNTCERFFSFLKHKMQKTAKKNKPSIGLFRTMHPVINDRNTKKAII